MQMIHTFAIFFPRFPIEFGIVAIQVGESEDV
jgi:hypothetical protein